MSQSKKHLKNTNFNTRIDPQLKAECAAATESEDGSAGHALRIFMRRCIARHRNQAKGGAKWGSGLDQLT
jgi:hypothetical protein